MEKKFSVFTFVLALMISMIPVTGMSAYAPPTSFGAPQDVAVQYHETSLPEDWDGFDITVGASNELRSFVDVVGQDNSPFTAAGFYVSELLLQLDYKVDNGSWHYKSQWDEDYDYNNNKSIIRIEKGTYSNYAVFNRNQFESISSSETVTDKRAFFDNHTMDIRVRFLVKYQDSNGKYYGYYSPWSQAVAFSNKQKAEDAEALINHVPVLKSAEVKKYTDGRPNLIVIADKAHEDIQHLNSISGSGVKTEVWLKSGTGDWKLCHSNNFVEEFNIVGSEAYFGLRDSYDAAVYEIKFRYLMDYNSYPAAGKSGIIYSPWSNIISKGAEAYSNASSWAKPELDKANNYGLIPDSLKGADMTRPITREEFAELSVKLYEKTTGTKSDAASPNPFTDTINPEILKAFKLGITAGTSPTTFTPKELTNREQVATMLSRAIRKMVPKGDFSTEGAPVFTDQSDISSWALEHVMFMSKAGIIKGSDGKFMPKATTSAQIAEDYATTTREQAIAMSVRAYEKYKSAVGNLVGGTSGNSVISAGSQTYNVTTSDINKSLAGKWKYSMASGNVGLYISLELNGDDTFYKLIGTSTSFSVSGTSFEGKYKVSGDKILFYNQSKGTGSGSSLTDMIFNPKIENVPAEDKEEVFKLVDSNTLQLGTTEYLRVK